MPNSLFQTDARASQGKTAFNLEAVEIRSEPNLACKVANLVLQAVTHNTRRHDELQRFMLTTDPVTIAVEVPIFRNSEDIAVIVATPGFDVPMQADQAITGHIDFLQIRNGRVHILDYKPKARLERPIPQLMTYALALSRRTGIRLFDIVCAWFDEHDYYEFYPLSVVHKRSTRPSALE
jgi:ATP-dependent exoDNAse (exonuclease V) beta subunit